MVTLEELYEAPAGALVVPRDGGRYDIDSAAEKLQDGSWENTDGSVSPWFLIGNRYNVLLTPSTEGWAESGEVYIDIAGARVKAVAEDSTGQYWVVSDDTVTKKLCLTRDDIVLMNPSAVK